MQGLDWNGVLRRHYRKIPGQTEICQFDEPVFVDENVARLYVSVKDSVLMKIIDPRKDLKHNGLYINYLLISKKRRMQNTFI